MLSININRKSIFKMSMGYIWKLSRSLVAELETRHWIAMGVNTGKNQVPEFRNARINDLVYVCYGSERLSFLAEITSEVRIFPDDLDQQIGVNADWIYREVRILHQPINHNLKDLTSNKLGYMPSGNSTFYRIPQNQIQNANRLLFEPKYDIHFVSSDIQNNSITNSNNIDEDFMENQPLNQILYGPPGTGKTYLLQNNYFPLFREQATSQTKEDFEYEVISKLKWWQVIAMILLEKNRLTVPEMKEHRFTKYKISVSNTKSLNQTFWGQLSSHTIQESKTVEYSSRSKTLVFNKEEENSIWFIEDSKKTQLMDLIELLNEIKSFQTKPNNKNNFSFITFHQSYAYEDFVIGIKPTLNDDDKDDNNTEIAYQLEKGVFYKSSDEAAKLAGFLSLKDAIENYSKEERYERFKAAKPFGLFIDEINRGNVSAIFGELITLIEDDKRLGKENELILNIPNAEKFAVPSNLYLIGTMNTADRSVEALDTALRRRFSFVEMLPQSNLISPSAMFCRFLWKYEKVDWQDFEYKKQEKSILEFLGANQQIWDSRKNQWEKMKNENNQSKFDYFNDIEFSGINLEKLLNTINERIEVLVDRDHTIGHAYFMNVFDIEGLKFAFQNKIIPLLQEYFYGNYIKMEMVIGSYFFEDLKNKNVNFAIENHDFNDLPKQYKLKNILSEEFNMIDALNSLYNEKKDNSQSDTE